MAGVLLHVGGHAFAGKRLVDPSVADHVLVLHSETAEGGWGAAGVALGREDFEGINAVLKAGADPSGAL